MKRFLKKIGIFIVFVCLMFALCGCATMDVSLNRDGSGSATLTVSKTALLEKGVDSQEELEAAVEEELKYYNTDWTIQRVTLKKITETDESYSLHFKLARVQKLEKVGRYELTTASEFVQNSNTKKLLTNWAKGSFERLEYADGSIISVPNQDFKVQATDYESGEIIPVKTFTEETLLTDKLQVFAFLNYDVELIEQVTLHLPGHVKYYSAETMQVSEDGKTVVITPQSFTISVLKVEDGAPTNETKTAKNYVGFVVYEETVPVFWIVFAAVCGAALIGLLFVAIKRKWFKKLLASRSFRYVKREHMYYLMILPGIVLLGIFCYGPMVGIYTAFTSYDPVDGIFGSEFVGLKNFINMFDPRWDFWNTLRNTLVIALLKFIFGYPASIILALLFTYLGSKYFKSIMQTVSYLPYFLSWVMISGIAYNFLTANNGILNRVLEFFGKEPIKWYSDPTHWWTILTLTSIWKGMGYGTITFLAGLSAINTELYEAASIDGAGKLRQVFVVTLPGLMPVISFTFILNMGNLIKDDYEQILALCGENNAYLKEKVDVLGSAVFNSLSSVEQYSSGAAMGLFQSTISLIFVTVANHILVKHDQPGIW